MFDGQRFSEAEHDAASYPSACRFMFAAPKDDVVVVEPDVEEFGTALTTTAGQKAQGHGISGGRLDEGLGRFIIISSRIEGGVDVEGNKCLMQSICNKTISSVTMLRSIDAPQAKLQRLTANGKSLTGKYDNTYPNHVTPLHYTGITCIPASLLEQQIRARLALASAWGIFLTLVHLPTPQPCLTYGDADYRNRGEMLFFGQSLF